MRVVVLGAGLAGLSAAHSLSKGKVDVTVLEKESKAGGMARSFSKDGFTYDLGPHRFHTKDKAVNGEFLELMAGRFDEKERLSRIRLEGIFIDYPLKVGNAMFTMPPLTTARIVADYIGIKAKNLVNRAPDDNFENWVVNRFGWKLYDIYFKVYTEKTWGMPCTKLSADWAAQRISLMSLLDTAVQTVKKTIVRGGDTPRTYVSRFNYPKKGGIGALTDEYARKTIEYGGKISLDSKVTKVKVKDGAITEVAHAKGKETIGPDDLVFSTIPLTELVASIEPKPPQDVLDAAKKLSFRSIVFVHLMFKNGGISKDHWIYLPELRYLANRLSESRNFSEQNAPEGKTIVGAEITCQAGDETWKANKDDLAKRVLDDMADTGLVRREEYIGSTISYMEHAYPIYDLEYRTNLDKVTGYLKTVRNLRFFGRNGLFRYNNMDHSVGMGQKAANTVTDKSVDYMKIATEEHWFG